MKLITVKVLICVGLLVGTNACIGGIEQPSTSTDGGGDSTTDGGGDSTTDGGGDSTTISINANGVALNCLASIGEVSSSSFQMTSCISPTAIKEDSDSTNFTLTDNVDRIGSLMIE